MTRVTIIVGGNSVASRLTGVLEYTTNYLEKEKVDIKIIQVHQLPSDALITADFTNEAIKSAQQHVEESEGVIFLTPIYKASYSGILKTFIDLLPQKALKGKEVLPLVLGGTYGHLLVIDYVLKPVLMTLGTTTIQNGVFVLDKQVTKQEKATYFLDEDSQKRLDYALEQFKISLGGKNSDYYVKYS
ncbi:NADPH-dependent FMN reductase [Niallia circulans]|jgi:FMN reductase|uniref:NADPH-dependent FMN reductase n=1 Tax=Niallia circulans TaxID=1397 RepID=UPI002E1B0F00|nr:NADPH-dependent FMN reductase [Niallia circulans]MED5100175.1 NADPH-dependent FMN reductase [Niallia circulans]